MENKQFFGIGVEYELAGLDADPRLELRAQRILEAWKKNPGIGFPQIFEDPSQLEGAYRFFSNPYLTFEQLLSAHKAKAIERAVRWQGMTLVLEDTSTFVFEGQREGLGFINKNNRGFLGHFALAVAFAPEGPTVPLGVVAGRTWVRTEARSDKKVAQHQLRESDDCESHRWLETALEVDGLFKGRVPIVHVQDREGDIYDSTSTMVERGVRFVVRVQSNRCIESADPEFHLLFDALEGRPVAYRDTVTITTRQGSKLPDQRTTYPARKGREALVCATATTVTVRRTRNSSSDYPARTTLNIVHVFEPNPPEGEEPVVWILMTTEPVSTEEEIRRVVAIYRQRWLIEEFFKAIKTGCAYEKRQLGSYHALSNALAMTIPIAWSLLLLRCQSRTNQSFPASAVLDPLRLKVLSAHARRYPLPQHPTLLDVAHAVAGLGGWLKHNGPPGWLTLKRGLERLLTLEEGWLMAREHLAEPSTQSSRTCDQS
jgi:hypothetical protein